MSKPTPSPETIARQRSASDPQASAWVSANAGSGKTYVLAQRVIRLMLAGTPPGRILCLTFTKAAAANMANRVFAWLSEWTRLDDAALAERIMALGEPAPDAAMRARARRLFAQALETPGGLKILTIHGFCERVLQQFPFEANVTPRFSVLDDRTAETLIEAARGEVLTLALEQPEGPLGHAFRTVIESASDDAFTKALTAVLKGRGALRSALVSGSATDIAALIRQLARALDLEPGITAADLVAERYDNILPPARWLDVAEAWRTGSPNDQKIADKLDAAARATDSGERWALYCSVFFTAKGDPAAGKTLATKAIRDRFSGLVALLEAEQQRLIAFREREKRVQTLVRTEGLLTLADAIISRYRAAKAVRGAMDFDDLIAKTGALLSRVPASWVLFKLDGGLDHILVDEAQDTNAEQWDIIARLSEEFTAGESARSHMRRTVFAVGDEKQSIYGFQGAAPEKFDEWRRTYARRHAEAGLTFSDVRLVQSFRSSPHVLTAVDHVFSRPEAYEGLEAQAAPTVHETVWPDRPGLVEIWPMTRAEDTPSGSVAWDAPFDALSSASPTARLAERIAGRIHDLIREGVAQPGDVLVLVRSRGPLFEAILRALKRRGVPVAGADRLVLGEHIAVLDLLALGDVITLPADDLALASVLKSPLFGLDDDDLLRFAPERTGSLLDALGEAAAADARLGRAHARLMNWLLAGRRLAPFDFYTRVLGADGGRRAFRARLGREADDVLDEFLNRALDYERENPPSLTGFLAAMRAASVEVKRDLDVSAGEVRVMTAHGAKGLEAKVVLVADLGLPPDGKKDDPVLVIPARDGLPALPVWSPGKDHDCAPVAEARLAARQLALAEHRRLLYVALTRAEDRLVVGAALPGNRKDAPEQSWYGLTRAGLLPHATAQDGEEPELRFGVDQPAQAIAEQPPATPPARPAWLDAALAPETAPRRARPSDGAPLSASGAVLGRLRGTLLHTLLEKLPALPPEARVSAAQRFVDAQGAALDSAARAALAAEAVALAGDPRFAAIFGPDARAEVPVAGHVDVNGVRLTASGRIDRLVREDDGWLIVDFKSERSVPDRAPDAYVIQLALYRALLMRAMPGKIIRAAVLWTAVPRLERIEAGALDAALRAASV